MKNLGIYTCLAYPRPLEEKIALIKQTGFDVIGLDFEEGEEPWEFQLKLAQKYAMPVTDVHLTGVGMSSVWEDGDQGQPVIDRLIKELREMSNLGIEVGVAHITWGLDRPPAPTEHSLRYFYQVADAAEKYGVKLALENSAFAEHVRYVLDHIDSKHIGFCFDSGHENAFTHGERYLESYADRLLATHLHDNDGTFDKHDIPGRGNVDWEDTVRQLKKAPLFEKQAVLELGWQGDLSLEDLLTRGYEALKKIAEM